MQGMLTTSWAVQVNIVCTVANVNLMNICWTTQTITINFSARRPEQAHFTSVLMQVDIKTMNTWNVDIAAFEHYGEQF